MGGTASQFSYPRPNLIVNSEGYTVEVHGRDSLLYSESDQSVDIFAEQLTAGSPTIVVRAGDVRNWRTSGGGLRQVSQSDRTRILANIGAAFSWKGWKLIVE
jgi:hypothetical protein